MRARDIEVSMVAVLALAVTGALLVLAGLFVPAYADEAAYRAVVDPISLRAERSSIDDSVALAQEFVAAGRRYATIKWPLMDVGYSCFAWSILVAGWRRLNARKPLGAVLQPQRRWLALLGLSAMSLTLLAVAAWEFEMRQLGRNQLPWWADSIIIGIVERWALLVFAIPFVLALALGPVARRGANPESILVFAGASAVRSLLVGLIYALPILLAALLATQVYRPGGWAMSTGGAILCWLFLNGRALLVGPSRAYAAARALAQS